MKKSTKTVRTVISLIAAVSMIFVMCACTPSEKVEKSVREYLNNKYGDLNFELVDYTQNKSTNGWYIANVKCTDTDIVFTMYLSSMMITDGYGIAYANKSAEKMLREGPLKNFSDVVKSVTWMSEFEDGLENCTFRQIDISNEITISDIKTIKSIELQNCNFVPGAANTIYNIVMSFERYGDPLEEVIFTFEIGEYFYTVKTNHAAVSRYGYDEFAQMVSEFDKEAKKNNFLNIINLDITVNGLNASY